MNPVPAAASTTAQVELLLASLSNAPLNECLALWGAKDPAVWCSSPELFRRLGDRVLRMGEPLIAYDIATEGLKHFADDLRLRQVLVLALARTGATANATALLAELVRQGHIDEETIGLLARTYKDLALRMDDPLSRANGLHQARDCYLEAYQKTGGFWTGINAATLSVVIDEPDLALHLARRVRQQCLAQWNSGQQSPSDRFWLETTLGEAALVMGDNGEACEWYCRARASGSNRYADLNSAKRNARLLVEHRKGDWSTLAEIFRVPRIGICIGHMIDAPNRAVPRFPPLLEEPVKLELRRVIHQRDIGFGYSSAACGSDILFLEAILESGGEARIVLPYSPSEFRRDSVDFLGDDGSWARRFEQVLKAATSVTVASNQRLGDGSASFEFGNRYLRGMAALQAKHLDTELCGIAVWDKRVAGATGGTSHTVAQWQAAAFPFELIDVEDMRAQAGITTPVSNSAEPSPAPSSGVVEPEFAPSIRALLFADAVGFSKLREDQIPRFVRQFLGSISHLIRLSEHHPIYKNTWGDGLFFVFDSVSDAGLFALELQQLMAARHFGVSGLPESTSLRIGLHAGPVYSCFDPVLERTAYVGTHVSRAARIEPITPPGDVYASEAFASLAAAANVREFSCEYVGRTAQAKGYGTFPTYLVRRQKATSA